MREWIDIAELAHTKNLNGGLVARSAAGLPLLLSEGMQLALVPPVIDAPRSVTVASLRFRDDYEAVVFFEEVNDASIAEALVGCHCLARRAEIDFEAIEEENDLPSWDGWRVEDEEAGYVGLVSHIEDRPLQPLLVVEREGRGEALIPLVEEFLVEINEDERVIYTRLAPGLLDL